jgi:hypothetical protein
LGEGKTTPHLKKNRMLQNATQDLGIDVGCCEHGDEPSGSIKDGEFIDWLKDYQLLKKNCAPWT